MRRWLSASKRRRKHLIIVTSVSFAGAVIMFAASTRLPARSSTQTYLGYADVAQRQWVVVVDFAERGVFARWSSSVDLVLQSNPTAPAREGWFAEELEPHRIRFLRADGSLTDALAVRWSSPLQGRPDAVQWSQEGTLLLDDPYSDGDTRIEVDEFGKEWFVGGILADFFIDMVISVTLTLMAAGFLLLIPRPKPRGHVCTECGYDLRGLTESRCPECGAGAELHE